MAARRTRSRGTPAALAMASAITPSSAPWRSSPRRSRPRSCPSGSVARANSPVSTAWRSATDPGPVMPSIVVTARSTSATVRVGSAAGVTSTLRTDAQPMPTRPCRGRPTRKPDRGFDLGGIQAAEQVGQRRHLGRAPAGGGDRVRGRDEVGQQHGHRSGARVRRRAAARVTPASPRSPTRPSRSSTVTVRAECRRRPTTGPTRSWKCTQTPATVVVPKVSPSSTSDRRAPTAVHQR